MNPLSTRAAGAGGQSSILPQPDPPAPVSASPPHSLWPLAAFLCLGLLGLALLANPASVNSVWELWQADAYSYSPIVVLIAGWLVWRRREALMALQPAPSSWGLAALFGIAVFWWLGHVTDIHTIQQLALAASVSGLAWSVLGTRIAWLLAFPLLYLFLTVKVWDGVNAPLQDATTWLSNHGLRLLGVPVFRDGYYLSIPEGRFIIKDTCAGLRYFLAGLSIGALYAYLTFDDLWRRGIFIGLTVVWALLVNVLRVIIVIYAGHVTHMQHSLVKEHGDLGWILFGVGLIFLFMAGALLQRTLARLTLQSLPLRSPATNSSPAILALAGLAAAIILSAAPAGAYWAKSQWAEHRTRIVGGSIALPRAVGIAGWEGPLPAPQDWNPRFDGTDADITAQYRQNRATAFTYQGWYAYERPVGRLIDYENELFERDDWKFLEGLYTLTLPQGALLVREYELIGGGGRRSRLIWSWYRVAGLNTTSLLRAKLLMLLGLVRGIPDASVMAVGTDMDGDRDTARQTLRQFLENASQELGLSGQ